MLIYSGFLILAGVVGVEPTSGVLETLILPMNYTPICYMVDFVDKYNDTIILQFSQ